MSKLEHIVTSSEVVTLCSKMLRYNDKRLIDHGVRVGYIANLLSEYLETANPINNKCLYLLSVLHDIGAYKTEEVSKLLQFETDNIHAHSVYGYLFIKHLTPLKNYAKAILYHHYPYDELNSGDFIFDYAQLLHIADRIDIGLMRKMSLDEIKIELTRINSIHPKFLAAFHRMLSDNALQVDGLKQRVDDYKNKIIASLEINADEIEDFVMMLVYIIDFKSPATMLHSVNTTAVSGFLAEKLGLDKRDADLLYSAALVHDVGKITTPTAILESEGKLSDDEMTIMKLHTTETENLLYGVFTDEIIKLAASHHEKLDGTGYPHGLTAEEMPTTYRALAVADITSALIGKRSYKDSYSWDKTIGILRDMAKANKIDADIVEIVAENFVELQQILKEKGAPVAQKYNTILAEYKEMLTYHDLPEVFYA